MTRYLIVDDEPIAHRIIEDYCAELPFLTLQENCYNALEALQYLKNHRVDLIFLDLNMPKLKGFDFLKTLNDPPKIIVTTAYKEFAIEGYELNVCDYLLKPFSFERFIKAINKAVGQGEPQISEPMTRSTPTGERLFLKGDKRYHQVRTTDILYIEAYGNYSKVYLTKEMILTNEKISSFESLLPSGEFLRVHKSFVVSVEKINQIEGNRILIQEHAIPIGQFYKRNVTELLRK